MCLVCGNIVKPTYRLIARGMGGCRTYRYIKSGKFNSNSEVEAVTLMLKNNLKPLKPYQNEDKPWKSICVICKKIVNPPARRSILMSGVAQALLQYIQVYVP